MFLIIEVVVVDKLELNVLVMFDMGGMGMGGMGGMM